MAEQVKVGMRKHRDRRKLSTKIYDRYVLELGGEAHVSAAQRNLCKRAAMLEIDLSEMEQLKQERSKGRVSEERYDAKVNSLHRILKSLYSDELKLPTNVRAKVQGKPEGVSNLRDYLESTNKQTGLF